MYLLNDNEIHLLNYDINTSTQLQINAFAQLKYKYIWSNAM